MSFIAQKIAELEIGDLLHVKSKKGLWERYIVIRNLGDEEKIWGYWLETSEKALEYKDVPPENNDARRYWGFMNFSSCNIRVLNRQLIPDQSPIKIEIIEVKTEVEK